MSHIYLWRHLQLRNMLLRNRYLAQHNYVFLGNTKDSRQKWSCSFIGRSHQNYGQCQSRMYDWKPQKGRLLPVIFPKHQRVWNRMSEPISTRCKAWESAFSMPVGAKMVMTSQSARVEKMFASFDLGSVSISFVGMMGDFAVWAWFLFISPIWVISYDSYTIHHFAYSLHRTDRNHWKAITDLSTGEIMYLIDDNGGSEIYYARKTAQVP